MRNEALYGVSVGKGRPEEGQHRDHSYIQQAQRREDQAL